MAANVLADEDEPVNADVEAGDETQGNVTLNPGFVKGEISIGDVSSNTVEMTHVVFYADSRDAIGNALRADLTLNKTDDDLGNYDLTVHIPDETWKTGGTQDYRVSCVVKFDNDGDQYLAFKSQHADVLYMSEPKIVNFKMTPGYISGELVTNCEFKSGWIRARTGDRYNDNPNYTEARIETAPAEGDPHRMRFHFPVAPCKSLKVWGHYELANGWAFDLEEKTIGQIAAGEAVDPGWEVHQCNETGCERTLKGQIGVEGLGEGYVLDRHEVYLKGATRRELKNSTGSYEFGDLREGEHQLYVYSRFNKYEDILYHPFADYNSGYYDEGRKYYDFIKKDITCGEKTENVISKAAFVSGKIFFKKDATVVAFKEDQDPENPMPGLTYCLLWGHGMNGARGVAGGDRNGWAQHRVDRDTGKYKLLLTEGEWNIYSSRFDFCHREEIDLCGDGNPKYVNTRMYVYDYTRSNQYGHDASVSLNAGETLGDYNIEYETGAVTIKFHINGGGQLSEPSLYARNITEDENGNRQRMVEVSGWGAPVRGQYADVGEATIIGTPGEYTVQAKAKVNGVMTTFGEEVIHIVAGICQTFEFGAPTLTMDEQASDLDPCGGEITLSGKATDADAVTGITINGEPVDFVSTDNPDDSNEVSFSQTISLEDGVNKIETVVANVNGKETSETRTIRNYTAGVFNISEDGIIKADYLFDGGAYEGELGIFSLDGMGDLEPGSEEFIAEAIRRVLSDSEQGHVLIRDKEQGARFDGPLGASHEGNFNEGPYVGLHQFSMKPGDRAALVLIPDGTFEEVRENPSTTNAKKQPLFSLATANPDDGLYYGQIAGIPVDGMDNSFIEAIAFEDLPVENSDQDYNDLILQLKGATVCSPTLDVVINEEKEWRTGEDGVSSHLNIPAPDENGLWLTFTLKSPADLLVYDPQGRMIGKEGGTIPGATFEWNENGHQVVTLPALEDGDYNIVLRSIGDGGLCHLEVRGFQGDEEVMSEEKPLVIEPHQVLKTVLSVSDFIEKREIAFETPAVSLAPDGTRLPFDLDGDGDVDSDDIDRIGDKWGLCEGDAGYDYFYDLDGDGCIEFYDIASVANQYHVAEEADDDALVVNPQHVTEE
ncbi:hypothetical protein DENIS_0294 [Desulfonema ishimotonii]|uniref:DUF4114 domain-containing protein n=1 Tax=Desulfonema ishimotonii TaxID=45657 RepID=A0A401FQW6_9BACT|nr:DUF4114 domain-containing protein [Desulfonema ishimotonii]GBC59355.1 hypothetical protein DENIS_0294 [Desulfonema ishimotonii]